MYVPNTGYCLYILKLLKNSFDAIIIKISNNTKRKRIEIVCVSRVCINKQPL